MENLGELFAAMALARQEFGTFTKSKTATIKSDKGNYGYAYADLSDIIEATAAALAKHGLVVIQEPEVVNDAGRQVVIINGCIAHKAGGVYQFRPLPIPVVGGTAQAIGSAISYARRYQLSAVLNLAAADDDGNAASDGADATPLARQPQATRTPTAQKAHNGTVAPKRTVDASTGEIAGNDGDVIFDTSTPDYAREWQALTGKEYDLVKWVSTLHKKSSEPCTLPQYQFLTGILDKLTKKNHRYALSLLCQSVITKENLPGRKVADSLLDLLAETFKGDDDIELINPNYRKDMAELITKMATVSKQQPELVATA